MFDVVCFTPVVVSTALHIILGTFLWRSAMPTGGAKPAARYGHSAVIYKKSLYVLLGQDTESDYNDVWTVNMKGMYVYDTCIQASPEVDLERKNIRTSLYTGVIGLII